jgi:hypothetical protein
MLPGYRPNFVEVASAIKQVKQACGRGTFERVKFEEVKKVKC